MQIEINAKIKSLEPKHISCLQVRFQNGMRRDACWRLQQPQNYSKVSIKG